MLSLREKLFIYFTATWFAVLVGVHAVVFEPMADGQKAPDSQFTGYTLDTIAGWAGALDANEHASFLWWHSTLLDFIFPFLLMAALYVLLTAALRQLPRYIQQPSWIRIAVPLALVAPYGLFDLLENSLVADMLRGDIEINEASVGLASSYTVLKYSFIALGFAAAGVFWLAARRQQSR
ncbi:MAG: hypothetical protein AAGG69_04535 [Pseudomonadota bacterium]